jgi:hypothetical protein
VFNDQHFEFLSNAIPAAILTGLNEPDDPRYAFLIAYRDAKASGR